MLLKGLDGGGAGRVAPFPARAKTSVGLSNAGILTRDDAILDRQAVVLLEREGGVASPSAIDGASGRLRGSC